MIVERQNNEILVRFSSGMSTSKIQAILDYLRYLELTSKSDETQENADTILNSIKKNRWKKTQERLGLND